MYVHVVVNSGDAYFVEVILKNIFAHAHYLRLCSKVQSSPFFNRSVATISISNFGSGMTAYVKFVNNLAIRILASICEWI